MSAVPIPFSNEFIRRNESSSDRSGGLSQLRASPEFRFPVAASPFQFYPGVVATVITGVATVSYSRYGMPLHLAFERASGQYPAITIDPDMQAGAPCVAGSRVQVFMVLDALQALSSIDAVRQHWYPDLSEQQIKDAIGFAKSVIEDPQDQ